MKNNKVGNENDRGMSMSEVKGMCNTVGKIVFCIVMGVGLIGFIKGLFVGYLICHYKDKCSLHNIKYTDTGEE